MGGKLFPMCQRLDRSQYLYYSSRLKNVLSEHLKTRVEVPMSIYDKADFGDIDMIVVLPEGKNQKDLVDGVLWLLKPEKHHANGNVFSFLMKDGETLCFQVDLAFFGIDDWLTALHFNSYGEYGNLVGKLAHTFGLKYSVNGLRYVYYYDNVPMCDIILSKETQRILEFLGLDYSKFSTGFESNEQLFEFIINSKYFSAETFLPESQNAYTRKRDTGRPVYWKFLEWLKVKGYHSSGLVNTAARNLSSEHWKRIDTFFPGIGFYEKIAYALEKENTKRAVAERWNGKLLIERYPDLFKDNRKLLGEVMQFYRLYIKNNHTKFDRYMLTVTDTVLWNSFESWLMENFNKSK